MKKKIMLLIAVVVMLVVTVSPVMAKGSGSVNPGQPGWAQVGWPGAGNGK